MATAPEQSLYRLLQQALGAYAIGGIKDEQNFLLIEFYERLRSSGLTIAADGTITLVGAHVIPVTIADLAVTTAKLADGAVTNVKVDAAAAIAWTKISKAGSSLADLATRSAADLSSGTLPDARFPATLPAASGVNLTALNATQLTSGTVPDARFPATLPALNGSALTNLNASNLASGTVAVARLPKFNSPLNYNITSTANAGVGETDLATYSLPGGTLAAIGDRIRVKAWGTGAANTNSKTWKIYFGATVVATGVTTSATSSAGWVMEAEIVRNAAATQVAFGTWDGVATGVTATNTTPGETLSGAITVKATGQSAVAGADITLKGFTVELVPAP